MLRFSFFLEIILLVDRAAILVIQGSTSFEIVGPDIIFSF